MRIRVSLLLTGALLLAAPCLSLAADAFTDVPDGVPFATAVNVLRDEGVVSGFPDGGFHPDATLNRASLLQILVNAKVDPEKTVCTDRIDAPFEDVPARAWFARAACVGKKKGLISGYKDGTFRPSEPVTLGEAAKLLAVAFGEPTSDAQPWHKPYLTFLASRNAIPDTLGSPDQRVTRAEAAEMLWRLRGNIRDLPSPSVESLLSAECIDAPSDDRAGIDMEELARQWLLWTNEVRAQAKLPPYIYDRQLRRTALIWSGHANAEGSITHKRAGQTAYYDYARMVDWFEGLGLTFRNDDRITFTENIGWGVLKCKSGDCTGKAVDAIRTTFDFYMSEKGKANRPHYNSIMNPLFRRIGLGVMINPATGRYYLTVHYGTEITSDPQPVCS